MTKRSTKRQEARALALEVMAQQIREQKILSSAVEEIFLSLADRQAAEERAGAAMQKILDLGKPQSFLTSSFSLSTKEVSAMLAASKNSDENGFEQPETSTDGHDESH
ncbi:hypothetical protein ACP8NE_03400 [Corynebacterium ulcerans]|uniref:hypothetical protein n=1 Tax=Corynebacterium ulcerans TaxID=65058 RepID=UPI003D6F9DAC